MINQRILRRRIRSVQSTAKITKAMEMIATAKMKRSQDRALAGRPYDLKISQIISDLAAGEPEGSEHPLLRRREVIRKITVVHITANKGLCGGLNSNMNKLTANFILEQKTPINIIAVGKKGAEFMARARRDIRAEFDMGDKPGIIQTLPISRIITEDFSNEDTDLVYLAYTRFVNTFTQKPELNLLLPIKPATLSKSAPRGYIYEPQAGTVLEGLLPRFVQMKVYHAVLEAAASELSAKMVAMRNATENANDLIQNLTLLLNKVRQEMITTELLDISGGVELLH
jgi:F-type H+-transporting ATPase subunit gamma